MRNITTNDKTEYEKGVKDTESKFPTALQPSLGEMTLKVVNPREILLTWVVSEVPEKILGAFFQANFTELVPLARIYDITDLRFTGKNAHHVFEITVPYHNGYSYVKGLASNRSYIAEIGVQLPGYNFFPFFRSNCIQSSSTDMPNNDEPSPNLAKQCHMEHLPKWREHVSTYSYYGEPGKIGEKHE